MVIEKIEFWIFDVGFLSFEGLSKISKLFDPFGEFGYSAGCAEIRFLSKGKIDKL